MNAFLRPASRSALVLLALAGLGASIAQYDPNVASAELVLTRCWSYAIAIGLAVAARLAPSPRIGGGFALLSGAALLFATAAALVQVAVSSGMDESIGFTGYNAAFSLLLAVLALGDGLAKIVLPQRNAAPASVRFMAQTARP
ncbi:MAG TPA: hypothetical protein VGV37_02730 [Aliidongia sp.]|uniref:hypothetical protein n=1 Tax=Aliidongia sp. TaxID=1914230 RepID=UPI002DDCD4AA|nr:hypothetical protein [Aliidongia sp.]HEV2673427.1 hypothetical protein [Aliidongia sp.]